MTSPPSLSTIPLQILSYNIWGAPFAAKKVKHRYKLIAEKLKMMSCDIIGLQEAFCWQLGNHHIKLLLEGVNYPFYKTGPDRSGFFRFVNAGLMTLSKHPIIESASLPFQHSKGTDFLASKGILFTRILTPHWGEVDVYNTHTNAGLKHREVRLKQIHQAIEFIQTHSKDFLRPILFLGDFNATEMDPEIELLKKSLNFMDTHQHKVHDGFTADPHRNHNFNHPEEKEPRRIDFIFYRKPNHFNQPHTVIQSQLAFEEHLFESKALSDHFGVFLSIQ